MLSSNRLKTFSAILGVSLRPLRLSCVFTQRTLRYAEDAEKIYFFCAFVLFCRCVTFALMKPEELKGIVHSDPEIMGGTPVFVGTRVPLQNLIDCLEGGESVEDFLEAYPTVKREQAIAVIEAGKLKMLETV